MTHYNTLQQLMSSFSMCMFFNAFEGEIHEPNRIARVLDVDEAGYCWLLFHCPSGNTFFPGEAFPARIRLYEKGRDCYVEAAGMAECILDSAEWSKCPEISAGMAQTLLFHGLVMRIAIDKVVVYELRKTQVAGKLRRFMADLDYLIMGKRISETIYQSSVSPL